MENILGVGREVRKQKESEKLDQMFHHPTGTGQGGPWSLAQLPTSGPLAVQKGWDLKLG